MGFNYTNFTFDCEGASVCEKSIDRIRSKSMLTYGGLVTAYKQDSEVDVVNVGFPKGSNSILSILSWESLRSCMQDN